MCAKARDELLRPGFKGGGTGSPFVAGAGRTTTATAGGDGASTFFKAATGEVTLAALPGAWTTALGKVLITDLGTDFGATFVAGFVAVFTAALAAVFAFKTALGAGLLTTFGAGLPEGFAIDF